MKLKGKVSILSDSNNECLVELKGDVPIGISNGGLYLVFRVKGDKKSAKEQAEQFAKEHNFEIEWEK